MIEILRQFAEFEILGNSVERPGLGARFESAEQQLAGVLLVIGAGVGVAQHGQVGRQAGEGLGDDIEVLAGLQRRADAGALGERAGPQPRRQHDDVGGDLALVGDYTSRARPVRLDRCDIDVLEHFRAAHRRALD